MSIKVCSVGFSWSPGTIWSNISPARSVIHETRWFILQAINRGLETKWWMTYHALDRHRLTSSTFRLHLTHLQEGVHSSLFFSCTGWHENYPDNPLFNPVEMVNRLVSEGKLGMKTGEGFYSHQKKWTKSQEDICVFLIHWMQGCLSNILLSWMYR